MYVPRDLTVSASLGETIVQRVKEDSKKVASAAAIAAVAGSLMMPFAASALTKGDIQNLTYMQVKGTGLANRCPEVVASSKGSIKLDEGKKYRLVDLCLEPKSFQVRLARSPPMITCAHVCTRVHTSSGVYGDP